MTEVRPSGMWSAARALAAQTPVTRNRYVEFLRAISICVVVFGHWLVGLPAIVDSVLRDVEVMRVLIGTLLISLGLALFDNGGNQR